MSEPEDRKTDPRDLSRLDPERGGDGRFGKGNELWRHGKLGRKMIYPDPQKMAEKCQEYFDWVDKNPIEDPRMSGEGRIVYIPRPRPMTIGGLGVFLGLSPTAMESYRKRDEFRDVLGTVEEIIREHKFAGAAAGVFNSSIISRDLGLTDKREVQGGLTVHVMDKFDDPDDTE